jgi:hypothetical protein
MNLQTVIGPQNVPTKSRNPRDVALPRHAFLAALLPVLHEELKQIKPLLGDWRQSLQSGVTRQSHVTRKPTVLWVKSADRC